MRTLTKIEIDAVSGGSTLVATLTTGAALVGVWALVPGPQVPIAAALAAVLGITAGIIDIYDNATHTNVSSVNAATVNPATQNTSSLSGADINYVGNGSGGYESSIGSGDGGPYGSYGDGGYGDGGYGDGS